MRCCTLILETYANGRLAGGRCLGSRLTKIDPEFLEVEVEALLELGDPEAALELVQMYEEATRDILAELEALVRTARGAGVLHDHTTLDVISALSKRPRS
jgi:hypothetical protein